MHLREAYHHTTANFEAGNAMAWIGPPGGGKTEAVKQIKKWMPKTYPGKRLGHSTIFMATSSPIGVGGLPWKGMLNYGGKEYTITDPALPQWFIARDLATGERAPADQFDKVLLVIEEWGQGDAETKRAGAELLNSGGCGGFYLPEGSFRLALSNNDVRDGITKEFDFVINRRCQLMITGSVDVWLEDFADLPQPVAGREWLVSPVTKAWAKQNPTILFEPKPKEQGPWCTPRSLTNVDRYAQVMASYNGGVMPIEDVGFAECITGAIGAAAGRSLVNHMRFLLELPSYEDVVKNPAATPVPTRPDLMMLMAYELAGRCKPEHIPQCLEFMERLKVQALQVTFVSALLRRDYRAAFTTPAMTAWMRKNGELVSLVATLAG